MKIFFMLRLTRHCKVTLKVIYPMSYQVSLKLQKLKTKVIILDMNLFLLFIPLHLHEYYISLVSHAQGKSFEMTRAYLKRKGIV